MSHPAYYAPHSEDDEHDFMSPSQNPDHPDEDEEEEEEEEEDDDFLPTTRPRAPPPIPSIPSTNDAERSSKRKRISPEPSIPHSNQSAVPSSSMSQRTPLPEPSFINAEPLDEFIREIGDWILRVAGGRTNIEIEAKIGVLIDNRTRARIHLPVMNETIISPDYGDVRFESNVALAQHAHFNNLLNTLVTNTGASSYPYARVKYAHTKLVDSFHAGGGSSKVRVTTDEKTGTVVESVVKTRLGDLNIHSPKRKVDWRVSINTEIPAPPPATQPTHTRRKDRITYTHQSFQIDLTQVTPSSLHTLPANPPLPPSQLMHELEVEFRDTNELLRLGRLRMEGREDGDLYDELVRVFVNNVRILARNAI